MLGTPLTLVNLPDRRIHRWICHVLHLLSSTTSIQDLKIALHLSLQLYYNCPDYPRQYDFLYIVALHVLYYLPGISGMMGRPPDAIK